ncbi:alpha-2-antiplasmin-like, partial [Scleropages formosus]
VQWKNMDLRLVSLLLITLGGQALSELDTTLFPTTVLPSDTAVTSSDPDYSYKPTTERNTTLQPEEEEDDSSEELVEGGCAAYISSDKAKQALGDAVMKFGLQLLKNLKKDPDEPNVIVSPLSVSLALSQLALGEKGSHALQVVSRMYLKPGFEVKKAFVEESQRLYKSYPATLTGLEEINEWVKEATKGEWEARFDPHFTSTELFHVDAKHMVKVDMMHGPKYPLSQMMHNELDAQVARFPFLGHMSLLIVMPLFGEVNIAEIAAKLNISDLYAHLPEKRNMQVQLPRFKLQYSQELQQALTSMGLGELFSGPNLPRIADGVLLVSSVQHKSSMELNEEGAEAAAATSVAILRSSSSFCVNQPFFFALLDDITQAPIFLGVITNPNPGAPLVQRSPERGDSNKGDKNGLYEKRPPK